MEYYVVSHDSRLDAMGGNILFPERVLSGFAAAEDYEMAFVRKGRKLEYRSVIELPVFLVSAQVREILSQYEPNLAYKTLVVTDQTTYTQVYFCLIDVPKVDCISQTHSVIERGMVREAVLEEEKISGLRMFWAAGLPFPGLIVRLDVAEALLRHNLYGLNLRRICSKAGEA
ncbi:hypothetical protein GNQ08_05395 [Paenibacillus macerans]|uniref:Uncharacterized protein n=2 Tax=Paenibacillus TaxID=44249 RepID=A0A090ZJB0_PAEMA|nr:MULTISPECIES: hypothetical protein [Paenibacillus]KFN10350.1 hypothetical protein DJ90_840 [Paenibacillus macerans]MCY7556874.1 hypothetical protein [Paenibacillus macerans]MEC0150075.1 hypothetical protein [Paenibacillus macerans]MEC0330026.1 hypothetical protein [Paenibacillus macerans]MUG21864.1 hypothetical protein [Paenibacillus macerans]